MKEIAPKLSSMLRVREYGNGTRYCHFASVLGEDVARELRAVLAAARDLERYRYMGDARTLRALARLDRVSR